MSELSLEPLQRVLVRLREGVELYQRHPDNSTNLDSLIKRFELAYELTRNTLLRFLEETSTNFHAEEERTLANVIRTANQDGLLRGTWEQWREFRNTRNQTAHTYDETRARTLAEQIPLFLNEAEFLLQQMMRRLDQR